MEIKMGQKFKHKKTGEIYTAFGVGLLFDEWQVRIKNNNEESMACSKKELDLYFEIVE